MSSPSPCSIRDNWLSNRAFDDIHTLIDHCCDAWNKLEAQPWTIMSLGMRDEPIGSDQKVLV